MKLRNIIRLPKQVSAAGEWKVVTGKGGKMNKKTFPISRDGYVLGRGWHWRCDELRSPKIPGRDFCLLTAYDPSIFEFRAWLAEKRDPVYAIVAKYEHHGDHGSWHCHSMCCDIDDIEPGDLPGRNYVRLPGGTTDYRDRGGMAGLSDARALQKSFGFFRVDLPPEGSLI